MIVSGTVARVKIQSKDFEVDIRHLSYVYSYYLTIIVAEGEVITSSGSSSIEYDLVITEPVATN